MVYLTSAYNTWVVIASVLIAAFASYVALDLAKRVRGGQRSAALTWWVCGSLVMGTGIWSMHFVGMLAYSLPIALGYTKLLSAVSWLAGVGVSAIALAIAGSGTLTARRVVGGSLFMGGGICAMHYLGMAAIDLTVPIVWNPLLLSISVAIAVGASAAALVIFALLRHTDPEHEVRYQLAAAVVMGLAISGMHYTGMAAANFPTNTLCLSAHSLAGESLGTLVINLTLLLLSLTLSTSHLDVRRRLAISLQAANDKLQSANEELQKRALRDPLTGLPNRVLFEDRLALIAAHKARVQHGGVAADRKLAVLFVDLDAFKPVNDSYGHAAGDQLLVQVASRLRRAARGCDTVARLGGDEFVLLLDDLSSAEDGERLAQRILQTLTTPFQVLGHEVQISASIGIAIYPDHGDADTLLVHADAAMYAAKHAGKAGYSMFEPHMNADARERLSLQNDLRHAITLSQLALHYQPKIDGIHGQMIGVEALLRWRHPERGFISPAVFIPIAERSGLIKSIGDWVIEEAYQQMHAWARDGLRMSVAINLSPLQLREVELVTRIDQTLAKNHLDPSQLLCEITESVAMDDIQATQQVFDGLEQIGVFLSIDDFGTGYSSLSFLRQLPARQLKIDRGFVVDLETNADARAVVDAVIHLAHALDLRVVAEGVETEGQYDILRRLGCDEMQGYWFAPPMPANQLLEWVMKHQPASATRLPPAEPCVRTPLYVIDGEVLPA
jgi:diguanylate cyclase (GGDEF)-like protein